MSRRKQLKPVHLGEDDEYEGKPTSPSKKIKPATDERGRERDKEDNAISDEPHHSSNVGTTLDKLRTRTQAKKHESIEAKAVQRPYNIETTEESPLLKKGKSTSGIISCQHCDRTFRTLRGLHTHERQHKKEVIDNNSDEESETTDEEDSGQTRDVEMEDENTTTTLTEETDTMKDQSDVQALDMSRNSCENYECLTFIPDTNNNIKNMIHDEKRELIVDDNGNVSPYLASRTCQICGKFCAKPSDLKRHMLIHSGERPFPCQVCGKSFKAKGSMLYHQKAAHHMDVELSPGLEERYQRQKSRYSFSPRDRSEDKIPFCDLERPSDSVSNSYQLYRSVDENNHEVVTVGKPLPVSSNASGFRNSTDNLEIDLSSTSKVGMLPQEGAYHLPPVLQMAQSQPVQSNTVLSNPTTVLTDSAQEPLSDTTDIGSDHSSPKRLKLNSSIGAFIQENKELLKNHFKIKSETVIISRLDGIDLNTKEETTLYKCYLCGRMFKFMSRLQCHLSTHVECEIVTYQCPFCNVHFPHKSQLRPHIKRHLESDGTTTDKTIETLPQQKTLTSDSLESDDERDNDTIETDKILLPPTDVENADSDKQEETTVYANNTSYRKVNRSYVCRFCRKGFFRLLSLQKHERLVHSQNVCKDCGKAFADFSLLRSHVICVHNHKKDLAKKVRKKAILASLLSSNRAASEVLASKKLQKNKLSDKNKDSVDEDKIENNQAMEEAKEILQQEGINEDITVVMPTDPLTDQESCDKVGDDSQTGSDANISETCSDNGDGDGIMAAPKRSLLSFCKDNLAAKSRRKCSQPVKIENNNNNTQININVKQEMSPVETSEGDKTNIPNMTAASLATAAAMNHLSSVFLANALTATSTLPHANTSSSPLMLPSPTIMSATTAIPAYPINQFMSVPITVQVPPDHVPPLSKTSASSSGSSKSSSSPVDRDNLVGFPRVAWTPSTSPNSYKDWKIWAASKTDETTDSNTDDSASKSVSLDSRKVTSLSRTHSRLHVINSPIDREKVCKPTPLPDGRVVYRCPFCHKDFVSFSDINRHMDFHEDIRPYKCKFCDYYARTNSQLKVHMMRHQGIREYCCKLCSYKGVTQSDLNRHMKSQIHLLKSQNECPHCGEGFVTQKNLTKHLSGNCIIKMYGKLRDSNGENGSTASNLPNDEKGKPEQSIQKTDDATNENNNNNYLKDAYLARYRESQLEQMHKEAVRAVEKAL